MTDTYTPVLTNAQILAIGAFGQSPLRRLDYGRAVERAAIEAYQRQQWRPIETAPMDGRTLLLGRFNSRGKWRTMRGQWMSADYIAENWEDPDDARPGWFETAVEAEDPPNCWPIDPSHWMPPPPAPEGS